MIFAASVTGVCGVTVVGVSDMQARTGIPAWAALPQYAAVVSAAFGQRRKQLRNSLSSLLEPAQMAACGIDPQARAETLSSDQFGLLAQAAALVVH